MKQNTATRTANQRRILGPAYPAEPPTLDAIRAHRILSRVAVSDALAREIGALAFTAADWWGARA